MWFWAFWDESGFFLITGVVLQNLGLTGLPVRGAGNRGCFESGCSDPGDEGVRATGAVVWVALAIRGSEGRGYVEVPLDGGVWKGRQGRYSSGTG